MRSRLLGTASLMTFCLFAANVHGANILENGDFELGNTGFSTSYNFHTTVLGARQYALTDNPPSAHFGAPSYGDHTTGSGLMMMVNGATAPVDVWSQTVSLSPNTSYEFSGFVSSWQPNPAQLDIRVDGTSIGVATAPAGDMQGIWEEFSFLFNSNSLTSATVTVVDLNTAASGNDFSLDDLSLSQVPIPPAVYLFVSGLLGLIGIARRKKEA